MADYEKGRAVELVPAQGGGRAGGMANPDRAFDQASMVQNWRNYAEYYVIPYIGQRDVQDIDGAVCDALYARLLAEGRVKASRRTAETPSAGGSRRMAGASVPSLPR